MDEKDFTEEYKRLFDGIKAGDKLKEKVLRQKPKRNRLRPIAAAIATTAAAVVIFASVRDCSFERDDSGIISTETVTEAQSPRPEKPAQQSEEAQSAAESKESESDLADRRTKTTDDYKKEALSGTEQTAPAAPPKITPVPNKEQRQDAKNDSAASKKAAPDPAPTAEAQKAPANNDNDTEKAPGSLVLPFRTGTVTLRMSAESVLTDIILESMQQTKVSDSAEEYHVEQWDNKKYFEYIGNDILNNIRLGSDMAYIGEDSGYFSVSRDGRLKDDQRIFVFNGSSGRSVSILTSRDTSFIDAVLSSPEIDKKNVSDIEMTAFVSDLTYFFYIKSNGAAYIVTTEGLNGDEIAELISSIDKNE